MFCSPECVFQCKLCWKSALHCIPAVISECVHCLNVFFASLSLFSHANTLLARIALVYINAFYFTILHAVEVRLIGLQLYLLFLLALHEYFCFWLLLTNSTHSWLPLCSEATFLVRFTVIFSCSRSLSQWDSVKAIFPVCLQTHSQ